MKNGKYSKRRGVASKTLVLALAVMLIVGATIGGTVAWLTAQIPSVTNTFTVGDINIELTESENLNLKMVPGNTITKDPKVTVKAGSEACWLFVKVEESANLKDFITYTVDSGWTQLKDANGKDVAGVYYREVGASNADQPFAVLANNQVTVNDTVTKGMMNAFDTNKDGQISGDEVDALPTLTFTAYAVQKENINSAADAWAKVNA